MAWRVMIEKKHSTRFSHEQLVGTKCRVIRWFSGRASHSVLVGGVVVQHDVQLLARVGGGGLLQEPQELLAAVPG